MIYNIYAKQTWKSFENIKRLGIFYKFIFWCCHILLMRLNLICIMKFNASCFALLVYLQKTLYFLVFHRDIGLKTGKHEFTDRIHQNKQGLEGKKLSGKEFLAFKDYQRVRVEDMAGSANCTQRFSVLFSCFDFCFLPSTILQNNLLHLHLVTIRLYMLSFFAKPATKSSPHFSESGSHQI